MTGGYRMSSETVVFLLNASNCSYFYLRLAVSFQAGTLTKINQNYIHTFSSYREVDTPPLL